MSSLQPRMLSKLSIYALVGLLVHSTGANAYCYYDGYGNYYCDNYLDIGARIGISIAVIAVCAIIAGILLWRRRVIAQRNNTVFLQNQQQQQPNQWGAPAPGAPGFNGSPGQPPYGGYPNNGYPMYPNNTGGPQPFQPGYGGGYTGGYNAKGYEANPNGTPVQEPARSYDPNQPFVVPPTSPPAPNAAPLAEQNHPPTYSGYTAPPGAPQTTGASHNPYNYVPPETTKS